MLPPAGNGLTHRKRATRGRVWGIGTILNISFHVSNGIHWLDIIGTRFLWKLIRKIISLLSDVGSGIIRIDEIYDILAGNVSIPSGFRPAPPENLVLVESVIPQRLKTSKYAVRRIMIHLKERFEHHNRSSRTMQNVIDLFSEPMTTFRPSTRKRTPSDF